MYKYLLKIQLNTDNNFEGTGNWDKYHQIEEFYPITCFTNLKFDLHNQGYEILEKYSIFKL